MRLRDLGLKVGQLSPGPGNWITDVVGVGVGHAAIGGAGLCSGITAIVPYPPQVKERRLFIGRYALDRGSAMTGLQVLEDFGTFSSPIVLAPPAAMGRVYQGLLSYGLRRDPGLDIDTGWPPLIVGVEDLNPPDQIYHGASEAHLETALQAAQGGQAQEGNAGIGRGLRAFGVKGGVGTSSRQCALEGGSFTVGALVAGSGGSRLWVDGYPIDSWLKTAQESAGAFAAVLATDAPLLSNQLDRLAQRAAMGLARVGLLDAATREGVVLAFSTAGPQGEGVEEQVEMAGEEVLPLLFRAALPCRAHLPATRCPAPLPVVSTRTTCYRACCQGREALCEPLLPAG